MSDFWAGYVSGAAGIIIGNPLEVVKVRLQAGSSSSQHHFKGSISTRATAGWTLESTRTLVRGLPAPILTYGALNALLFATYNRTLGALNGYDYIDADGWSSIDARKGLTRPWQHFTAGFAAGVATFVISAPTEVVKCRAQVARDETAIGRAEAAKVTSWKVVKETYRAAGVSGFYRGGVVTSLRDAVGYGFYFWTYEVCTAAWDKMRFDHSAPPADIALEDEPIATLEKGMGEEALKVLSCGGLAGMATWTSIFPLDVVKTRVQTQSLQDAHSWRKSQADRHLPGAWAMARHIYKSEGLMAFFRGLGVCNLRGFIVNAAQWAVYEWMMR